MRPTRLGPLLALCVLISSNATQAGDYKPPRTPYGAPDLQGIWTNSSVTMLQRPPVTKSLIPTPAEAAMIEGGFAQFVASALGPDHADPDAPALPPAEEAPNTEWVEMDMKLARIDGQPRSSWIVEPADGRLPFTDAGKAAARAAQAESFDGPEGRPTAERCLSGIGSPEGPPMMNTGYDANYQIVQTPGFVAIEVEMNHEVRIVRLGPAGRPPAHIPAAVRPWMGDSVGWWEGDTLVVETTNLNPRGAYVASLGGGFAYTADARVLERFTRTADDRILYEFSVDDPATFKTPWRAEMPFRRAAGPIYEYACHEGNYSLANALSGARAEERAAAEAAATPKGAHP